MNNSYTLEQKKAFAENVAKWKSELIKIPNKNIFIHPEKPTRPYYAIKDGKYWKHKPYTIINGEIRYTKNGETQYIPVQKYAEKIEWLVSPEGAGFELNELREAFKKSESPF